MPLQKNPLNTKAGSNAGNKGQKLVRYTGGKIKKMAKSSPSLLVFTKNLNGFKYPIKSHKLAEWIKK